MSIIYLDTETIPAQRPDVIAWMAAQSLAKREPHADVDKTYRASSLSPTLGELAVVSYALDDNDPITYVRDMSSPTGERDLVHRVAEDLRDLDEEVRIRRIVAHNAAFDRTVLRTRAMVHGVKLPYGVHALNLKPWDSPWYCTLEALRTDYRGGASLDAACVAFHVPLLKGDIDGSKVWDVICAGRIDDVARYCADDVRRVRSVYRAIMGVM
jgi:hypothetical protein